ncbi:hypothetical protein Asi03nite_11800 [Actinoplanes siamensis]|uniref:Uncharacterized protein n=1 Tax=Actinoplanes siamensis TaxID=1223317 RepID=A0A919N3E3_9ACTN|nr:hypothetical protein Asi03nite_11800 [Actinoplanes siamensis]
MSSYSLFSGDVAASATRVCNLSRISSGVYALRLRSARAITTPVAATPASPASPATFHHRIC